MSRTTTYIIGYISSLILTLTAFTLVALGTLPVTLLIVLIVALAVIQLMIQLVFFLHIGSGHGARWKIVTFLFAVVIIVILVGGSIWIMNNLNYNMVHMNPQDQNIYLKQHEGI